MNPFLLSLLRLRCLTAATATLAKTATFQVTLQSLSLILSPHSDERRSGISMWGLGNQTHVVRLVELVLL